MKSLLERVSSDEDAIAMAEDLIRFGFTYETIESCLEVMTGKCAIISVDCDGKIIIELY